jgi:hypothetical protein
LAKPLELAGWLVGGWRGGEVELDDLGAAAGAGVGDLDGDRDRAGRLVNLDPGLAVLVLAVRQPVAEREPRLLTARVVPAVANQDTLVVAGVAVDPGPALGAGDRALAGVGREGDRQRRWPCWPPPRRRRTRRPAGPLLDAAVGGLPGQPEVAAADPGLDDRRAVQSSVRSSPASTVAGSLQADHLPAPHTHTRTRATPATSTGRRARGPAPAPRW